jgi:hypothetical protein
MCSHAYDVISFLTSTVVTSYLSLSAGFCLHRAVLRDGFCRARVAGTTLIPHNLFIRGCRALRTDCPEQQAGITQVYHHLDYKDF